MSFSTIILHWYKKNKRDLPWRHTKDPYLIWLSEIILQQTRVEQGLPYYFRISEKYPTVVSLANAKEDEILRLWQGLGYYTRARNLHAAARQIKNEFDSKFPTDYANIRSLKGVGEYTAAAIASFAFDLEYAVVDGNVFRLLSRYFGIKTPIDTGEGKKKFTALAGKLIKNYPPAIYNQAIMEFGARQCRPANPSCETCPLNASCYAYSKNIVSKFPIKKNKTKSRNRYFNYLYIKQQNSFYIKKRIDNDIWLGLHDFPLIETEKKTKESAFIGSAEWKKIFKDSKIKIANISPEYKHLLSHQKIHARFYEIILIQKSNLRLSKSWLKVNDKNIGSFALPRLIERYLQGSERLDN